MKTKLIIIFALAACTSYGAIRYVNVNNVTPTPPYTNWAAAATVIQDAVDAADAGDEVVVTNGVYQIGGRAVDPALTNRVAITKPLTLRSVNGPEVTVIRGYQVPDTTNGPGAIRCVYLTNDAVLIGFTLTGGATLPNPGFPPTGYRDWYYNPTSGGGVGGAYGSCGIVSNCVLTGNSAGFGGGAAFVVLHNCVVTGNSAGLGGGTYENFLNNCTVTGNSARYSGGGDCYSTMNNCIVYFNSLFGDGFFLQSPQNTFNTFDSVLNFSCVIPLPGDGIGNIDQDPRLASASHLSADSPCRNAGSAFYASGVDIDGNVWSNPPSMGCDEFQLGNATGTLTVALHASFTNVATGFPVEMKAQILGHASANRWEFRDGTVLSNRLEVAHEWSAAGDYFVILRAFNDSNPAGVSATVAVHVATATLHHVAPESTNPLPPYTSWELAARTIQDAIDVALPGDEIVVTNGVYGTGGRAIYGTVTNRVAVTKPLIVRSVNGPDVTVIRGEQASATTNGEGAVRSAYLTHRATLIGFTLTNGATLTRGYSQSHQLSGGGLWSASPSAIASNCVFIGNNAGYVGGGAISGTLINCRLNNNSSARAGGGAIWGTLIDCTLSGNLSAEGGGTANSILTDCTITHNSAGYGGGVSGGALSNCIVSTNSAVSHGGGVGGALLNNCVLTGNSAGEYSGGAHDSRLNNCVLTGNSAAVSGGGVFAGTVRNCIVFGNDAASGANYSTDWRILEIIYSCTTPMPTNGVGNITNAPLFLDPAAGDFRLQSNSPCINAGRNAYAPAGPDLDGNPRIVGGTVDIGAYEFQSPQSTISYAWLQQFGLPIDGSADHLDPDDDSHNNWQEWRAGTDPSDDHSLLRLLTPLVSSNGIAVRWQSVSDRTYHLERSSDITQHPFQTVASNVIGQAGVTIFADTNTLSPQSLIYRVRVEE